MSLNLLDEYLEHIDWLVNVLVYICNENVDYMWYKYLSHAQGWLSLLTDNPADGHTYPATVVTSAWERCDLDDVTMSAVHFL